MPGCATEAERILARVARTFGAHGMRQARAEAEYHLARSSSGTTPLPRCAAGAAARRFRALGSEGWAVRAGRRGARAALAEGGRNARGGFVPSVKRMPSGVDPDAIARALESSGFGRDAGRPAGDIRTAPRTAGSPAASPVAVRADAPLEVRLLARRCGSPAPSPADARRRCAARAAAGIDELAEWQASFRKPRPAERRVDAPGSRS